LFLAFGKPLENARLSINKLFGCICVKNPLSNSLFPLQKAEPRREQILKLLEKTGILSVGELTDRFALSVVTIRKDLDDLASEGG
jgi:hypothetical protein